MIIKQHESSQIFIRQHEDSLLLSGCAAYRRHTVIRQVGKEGRRTFRHQVAVIMTRYPGAEPAEVERLVTEPISREIQSMSGVYKIKSESMYGLSKITSNCNRHSLPHPFRRSGTNCGAKCSTYSPNCPQALLCRPSRMILETFSASITAWWVTTVSLMKK